jgi:hypothetical protein
MRQWPTTLGPDSHWKTNLEQIYLFRFVSLPWIAMTWRFSLISVMQSFCGVRLGLDMREMIGGVDDGICPVSCDRRCAALPKDMLEYGPVLRGPSLTTRSDVRSSGWHGNACQKRPL